MVAWQRLGVRHVKGRPRYLAGGQSASQRVDVDDRTARRVDEVGRGFHARERLVADQAARLRRERAVEGHEVGALEQLAERHPAPATRGEELAAKAVEPPTDSLPHTAVT